MTNWHALIEGPVNPAPYFISGLKPHELRDGMQSLASYHQDDTNPPTFRNRALLLSLLMSEEIDRR
jgi:hypothetical protein